MKHLRLLSLIVAGLLSIFVIIPFLLPQFSLFLSSFFSLFLPRLGQFYEYDEAILKQENIVLQQKLNTKIVSQSSLDLLKKENKYFREMLELPLRPEYNYVHADVTGRNILTWKEVFVIGVGSNNGVREGCAVIANNFIVGQIVKITPTSSIVHTLLNPNVKVSCEVNGQGGIGILSGEVTNSQKGFYGLIRHLPREIDLPDETLFITSGLGGIIPRGLKVGELVKELPYELTREAHIRFFANFNKLYFVTVIISKL